MQLNLSHSILCLCAYNADTLWPRCLHILPAQRNHTMKHMSQVSSVSIPQFWLVNWIWIQKLMFNKIHTGPFLIEKGLQWISQCRSQSFEVWLIIAAEQVYAKFTQIPSPNSEERKPHLLSGLGGIVISQEETRIRNQMHIQLGLQHTLQEQLPLWGLLEWLGFWPIPLLPNIRHRQSLWRDSWTALCSVCSKGKQTKQTYTVIHLQYPTMCKIWYNNVRWLSSTHWMTVEHSLNWIYI